MDFDFIGLLNSQREEEEPIAEPTVMDPSDPLGVDFVSLLAEIKADELHAAQQVPTAKETVTRVLEEKKQTELEDDRRSGEGVSGFVGDIAGPLAGGVIRGAEMISKSGEWFAPGGSDMEEGAAGAADFFSALREDNPGMFGESRASEKARLGSAWDPRGWFAPGMESLGMIVPAAVTGTGLVGIATQFWGGSAQEAYDEAVENERQGIGKKLTETEKVIYSNLRGFFEGGMEAIQVGIASKIPALAGKPFLSKFIGRKTQENIVRGAVIRQGNPIINVTKDFAKTIAAEVPMELGQEYAGLKSAYEFGQSELDPGWDDIKGVIGATIVMSSVLGFSGQVSAASQRKQLHDALTKDDVPPGSRVAAIEAVYDKVKSQDKELADMWLEQTQKNLDAGRPVALPLDEEIRQGGAVDAPASGSELLAPALAQDEADLDFEQQAEEMQQDDLDTAEIKVRQKKAEIDAREEALVEEDIIEPVVEGAPRTVEDLDQQIRTMKESIEARPNSPLSAQMSEKLPAVKAQRAELLKQEAASEATTTEDVEAASEATTTEDVEADTTRVEKVEPGVAELTEMQQKAQEVMADNKVINHKVTAIEKNIRTNIGDQAADEFKTETEKIQAEGVARKKLDAAAHEAATSPLNDLSEPTEAQKEAGVYKKGHVTVQGLGVTIENPVGSTREGTSDAGKKWSNTMDHHYGYIKRTDGADGGNLDVYLGEKAEDATQPVFVVNQVNPETGEFDEHKVMMGFESQAAAEKAYLGEYEAGWKGLGDIQTMTSEDFKAWVKDGDLTVPASTTAAGKQAGVKYSATKKGQLVVDLDAVPDTIEVDTTGIDGTGEATTMKAKEAIQAVDKVRLTLDSVLACVNS